MKRDGNADRETRLLAQAAERGQDPNGDVDALAPALRPDGSKGLMTEHL